MSSKRPDFFKETRPTIKKVDSNRQDFFERSPAASALASKLIHDNTRASTIGLNNQNAVSELLFQSMIYDRAKQNVDNDSLLQLNPDLKIAKETIISTIMSPLSMDGEGLSFKTLESDIPSTVLNKITDIIRDHFTTYDDRNEAIPKRVERAQWTEGADWQIIVPESALDEMINGEVSIEAFGTQHRIDDFFDLKTGMAKPLGYLGSHDTGSGAAVESLFSGVHVKPCDPVINDLMYITDNMDQLKIPYIAERTNKSKRRALLQGRSRAARKTVIEPQIADASAPFVNTESDKKFTQVSRKGYGLYKDGGNVNTVKTISAIPDRQGLRRPSIGHPLVFTGSSAALIPAFVPGNPTEHEAYLLMLDDNNVIVDIETEIRNNIKRGFGTLGDGRGVDQTSKMIQQTRVAGSGYNWDNSDKLNNVEKTQLFIDIIEENWNNLIHNGLYGRNVKFSRNETAYFILMLRMLKNQRTRLLLVPKEQVSYLMYDHDDNGVGRSFLDGIREIAAIRSMTTFANFYTAVSNAVGRTKVSFDIDPKDPDPEKTYNVLVDQYLRGIAPVVPTDVSNSADMFRVMRQMGVFTEARGNSRLPQTTVDIEESRGTKQSIDPEFTEELTRLVYSGVYVTPEMIDATQDTDFAISRWTSNQLYSKRLRQWQRTTCRAEDDYIEAYTRSSGQLIHEIQKTIEEHENLIPQSYLDSQEGQLKYEAVIDEFFRVFYTELPSPDNVKLDQQVEALEKYTQALETGIDAYIVEEVSSGSLADENSNYIADLKVMIKAYMIRKWMADNNFLPELEELTRQGTPDEPALNFAKETMVHITNMANNMGDFGAALKLRREKYLEWKNEHNPEVADAIMGNSGGSSSSDTSSDNTNDDNDSTGGGDSFGDDPFAELNDNPAPGEEEGDNQDTGDEGEGGTEGDQPSEPTEPTTGAE